MRAKGYRQKAFLMHEKEQIVQWFLEKKEILNTLKKQIDEIDRRIDKKVYEIYGLNPEEIDLIEKYFE